MSSDDVTKLAQNLEAGDRRALARAITLIESSRADHKAQAREVLRYFRNSDRQAMRIGLSGTPGVGKSTFIETFGMMLTELGLRVAILAVDPSSKRSGGSILGDKTRMPRLARAKNAFIRPSPSRATLGGVAAHTRSVIELCEGAGFDIILVETVGVGQSETMVSDMTDVFLLLLAPAGGDELQGVKRGIMERADMVVVNKADGDLKAQAQRTALEYASALRLMRHPEICPDDFPKALTISAIEEHGIKEVWEAIGELFDWRKETGVLAAMRKDQATRRFKAAVEDNMLLRLGDDPEMAALWDSLAASVAEGDIPPDDAAVDLLDALFKRR